MILGKEDTNANLFGSTLGPACFSQRGNNHFLKGRFSRHLRSKNNDLGNIGRILEVSFLWHRNTQLNKAIEEVGTHRTWNDRGDTNTIGSAFNTQPTAETEQAPL